MAEGAQVERTISAAEAAALAARLVERPDLRVLTSLAGRTRSPAEVPGELRVGGFGGAPGLARYLKDQAIDLLVARAAKGPAKKKKKAKKKAAKKAPAKKAAKKSGKKAAKQSSKKRAKKTAESE